MNKREMFELFSKGQESMDQPQDTPMYFAMYAYEMFGCACRDNTFDQLVSIGKGLEDGSITAD